MNAKGEIQRINAAPSNTLEDAWAILNIEIKKDAEGNRIPVTALAIAKAYKKLAILLHPDKNPDEDKEAGAEAFKKLSKAKDLAENGKNSPSYDNNQYFGPDVTRLWKMMVETDGGGMVRQARDLILSWAGIFTRDVYPPKGTAEVREKLKGLQLGDDNAAKKDKEDLMACVNQLFPDYEIPSYKIAQEYAKENKGFGNITLFLSSLVSRYPKLRENYQVIFKKEVIDLLKDTEKSLKNIVQQFPLIEKTLM